MTLVAPKHGLDVRFAMIMKTKITMENVCTFCDGAVSEGRGFAPLLDKCIVLVVRVSGKESFHAN